MLFRSHEHFQLTFDSGIAAHLRRHGRVLQRGSTDVVAGSDMAKEFELLAYFVDHPRRVCTRTEILGAVWASNAGWQTEATVTEHVYRLRQKIETDPKQPRLRTVRAVGYRWEG